MCSDGLRGDCLADFYDALLRGDCLAVDSCRDNDVWAAEAVPGGSSYNNNNNTVPAAVCRQADKQSLAPVERNLLQKLRAAGKITVFS